MTISRRMVQLETLFAGSQIGGILDDDSIVDDKVWSSEKVNTELSLKASLNSSVAFSALTVNGVDFATALAGKANTAHTHALGDVTGLQAALDAKVSSTLIGAASGVAALDSGGKVPASQLPSFVDDVIEAANLAAFPATGEAGKIYVALDTGRSYRWGGSAYTQIIASPGTTDAITEGGTNLFFTVGRAQAALAGHTHTIANVTGLQTALDAKVPLAGQDTWTYFLTKGLVSKKDYGGGAEGNVGFDPWAGADSPGFMYGSVLGAGGAYIGGWTVGAKRPSGRLELTTSGTFATVGFEFNTVPYVGNNVMYHAGNIAAALTGYSQTGHTHTAANITDFGEAVYDTVAAILSQGTNVTLTKDDGTNTITVNAAGGGGGGGLGDADYGDVLVSGSSTVLTVESASGDFRVGPATNPGNRSTGITVQAWGTGIPSLTLKVGSDVTGFIRGDTNSGNMDFVGDGRPGGGGYRWFTSGFANLNMELTPGGNLSSRGNMTVGGNFESRGGAHLLGRGTNPEAAVFDNTVELNSWNAYNYINFKVNGVSQGTIQQGLGNIYHQFGEHYFRSANGSTIYATLNATGVYANVPIWASANINTAWSGTTPGTGHGSIVLPAPTVDNAGGAITWGAYTASGAAAGIYVKGNSAAGSEMFLGTSDSYAAGVKTSMRLAYNGDIELPRASQVLLSANPTGIVRFTKNGGAGGQLILESTGGTYGPCRLMLQNETGMNGPVFSTVGSTVDLVDFGFYTNSQSRLIRLEARSSSTWGGLNSWEFQIGADLFNQGFIVGNNVNASIKPLIVPDVAYGVGWNGANDVPTKNAVYDQMEIVNANASSRILSSEKGNANGVATLDAGGKVPSAQLPSYVDDVVEHANLAAFPGTGATGVLYIALDTNYCYRWSGSTYVQVGGSGSGGPSTTDDLAEGATNFYFTNARAAGAVLTGYTLGAHSDVAATDTILAAFGKIQKQITDDAATFAAHDGSGGAVHANVVAGGAAGFMTGADKTKLNGIATGATANTGTVTSVTVATANGVSATVANQGTTPALTISLGAITPSTVSCPTIRSGSATNLLLQYNTTTKVTVTTNGMDVTGTITATGNITSSSDARLKVNIRTLESGLDKVLALRGTRFEKDGREDIGVIAQEVEKVLPELVHTDAEGMKSVGYDRLTAVLIEAVKELTAKVEAQGALIAELQAR